MKTTGLTLLFLLVGMLGFSFTAAGNFQDQRALYSAWHVGGQMKLETTNFGCITELHYPQKNETDLLDISAPWISAKKHRRDSLGRLLYWITYPPTADNSSTVAEGEPGWNPGLLAVLDTLTTIGFDGDKDLYELLPIRPVAGGCLDGLPAQSLRRKWFDPRRDQGCRSCQGYGVQFERPEGQGAAQRDFARRGNGVYLRRPGRARNILLPRGLFAQVQGAGMHRSGPEDHFAETLN